MGKPSRRRSWRRRPASPPPPRAATSRPSAARGLVSVTAQGRHRYFRIAGSSIGEVVEELMGIASSTAVRRGPRDESLRRARVCYDHLAGEVGVRLFEAMHERRFLRGDATTLELTPEGAGWLVDLGIGVDDLRRRHRALVRRCLDWSERRDHLGGAVGAALLGWMFDRRLARRDATTRALALSSRGAAFVATLGLGESSLKRSG